MNTLTSSQILAGILGSNPAAFFPKKKVDDGKEIKLGTLSDDLQKIWAFSSGIEVSLAEAVAHFSDVLTAYKADLEQIGKLSVDQVAECQRTFDAALDKFIEYAVPYKIVTDFLNGLIHADFADLATKAKTPIIAVREDFQVIGREHDTRNDLRTPLCDFRDLYKEFLKVTGRSKPETRFYLAYPVGFEATEAPTTEEHPVAEEPATTAAPTPAGNDGQA